LQIPAIVLLAPSIGWAFYTQDTTTAVIFAIWSLVPGASDTVLKPLLIGRGLEVPMPVILIGVIGGVLVFGDEDLLMARFLAHLDDRRVAALLARARHRV